MINLINAFKKWYPFSAFSGLKRITEVRLRMFVVLVYIFSVRSTIMDYGTMLPFSFAIHGARAPSSARVNKQHGRK